jgi:hypothetical protein
MRWKQIEDEPRTLVLVFKTGDETASLLRQFSKEQAFGGK